MSTETAAGKGEVTIENGKATLRFVRHLQHTPEKVWQALTDGSKFGEWYNAEAEIDPKVGGMVSVSSGPFHWTGSVLTCQPYSIFEYEYNHAPVDEMPEGENTIVRWELEPSEGGTKLTFEQSRLSSTAGFAPGSHVTLDRLAAKLDGKAMPDFMQRYEEVESLYPVWTSKK